MHSLLGAAAGLVWMMEAKPDWAAAVVGVLIAFAVGWGAGIVVAGRGTAPA